MPVKVRSAADLSGWSPAARALVEAELAKLPQTPRRQAQFTADPQPRPVACAPVLGHPEPVVWHPGALARQALTMRVDTPNLVAVVGTLTFLGYAVYLMYFH